MESGNENYVQFIKRNQSAWGCNRELFTWVHLKFLRIFNFLEEETTYNEPFIKFMIKYFFQILKNSSMHGTFHVTQLRRHPFEILFWVFLLCLAGLISFISVNVFWLRYYFHPMVISIERDYMNWNVTFPSLTICETQKINKTALYDYVSQSTISDKKGLITFIQSLANINYYTADNLPDFNEIHPNDYVSILDKVTNKFENQIVLTGTNDSLPLQRVLTEMGICYMFNSKIANYMTPEYLIRNEIKQPIEEYKVNIFDAEKVAFLRDLSNYCCEIYRHNPLDVPSSVKKLNINTDQTMFTVLKFSAKPITATKSIRFLLISQRKCRFIDESNLKYFKIYSSSLCQTECKINAIFELCKCLPFFYKRSANEPYCNPKGLKCVTHNAEKIKYMTRYCHCYNNCEDTQYDLQEMNSAFWLTRSAIRWELSNTKIRLKRHVIFSYVDAFVSTGNVFNLFLGISVLSFVEGFYLYFIRLPMKCRSKNINTLNV